MRVDAFISEWRGLIPEGYFKPSTRANYESHIRGHVLPLLGAMELDSVTIRDAQTYVRRLQEKGLGPKSIRNSIMVLRVL